MRTIKDELLNASVSATQNTDSIDLEHMYMFSLQITTSNPQSLDYDVQLQASNDGVNFVNQGSATNVTSATSFFIEDVDITYRYARLSLTKTTGSANFKIDVVAKGV